MTGATMQADPAAFTGRLRTLVLGFERLLGEGADEPRIVATGGELLADLVRIDDGLPPAFARPGPEHYRQYPLHVDAAGRFSVISFVWGPGQFTPIHDHTVWGLIGVLRGAEHSQGYRFDRARRLLPAGPPMRLERGQVEAVSPRLGDVHRVRNAFDDRVSISIHVYGADIGRVQRSVYGEDGSSRRFVSGYSPVR